MRYFDDELISVTSTATPLTAAKIDNTGGSRATKALIQVRDAPVVYSFRSEPDAENSLMCGPGGQIQIEDYDNLSAVQFKCLTGGIAKLYVTYGN